MDLAHPSDCQKAAVPGVSVMGRVSDLGIVAKIMQSLSTVFRFYSK